MLKFWVIKTSQQFDKEILRLLRSVCVVQEPFPGGNACFADEIQRVGQVFGIRI